MPDTDKKHVPTVDECYAAAAEAAACGDAVNAEQWRLLGDSVKAWRSSR